MQVKSFSKIVAVLGLLAFGSDSTAQEIGVDQKGKSVFTYYSKDDSRLSFAADGNLAYSQVFGKRDFAYVKVGTNDTTVVKFTAWTFRVKLTSEEEFLSSDKFSKLRPGIQFQFGRQTSIDTFRKFDQSLPNGKKTVQTHGWNILVGLGNVKVFEPDATKGVKKYPAIFGVEGNFNLIFRNNSASSFRSVLAFTGSLTRRSNSDELKSYQELTSAEVLPTIVTLEESEGKYGELKKINNFRFSISYPMYIGHFNPIPFVVYNAKSYSMPEYHVGVFTNILKDTLKKSLFAIPSSLGIGFDSKYANNKFSTIVYYIKGEIKF
jgi:hypothetical protein